MDSTRGVPPLLTENKNTVTLYGLFQTAHLQVPPYRGTSYRGGSRATLTLHLPLMSYSSDSCRLPSVTITFQGVLPLFGTSPWLNINILESPKSQSKFLWRGWKPSRSSDGSRRLRWKAHHFWWLLCRLFLWRQQTSVMTARARTDGDTSVLIRRRHKMSLISAKTTCWRSH